MNNTNFKIEEKTRESISTGIAMVDMEINRNYLADLETHDVLSLETAIELKKAPNIRLTSFGFVKITRIVSDKEENFNEKLASVYSSLYTFFTSSENVDGAIIMLISGREDKVDYYLGIRHNEEREITLDILCCSLKGNFPGIEMEVIGKDVNDFDKIKNLLNENMPEDGSQKKSNFCVCSAKFKNQKRRKFCTRNRKFY